VVRKVVIPGKIASQSELRQVCRNWRAKNRAWLDFAPVDWQDDHRHNPQPGVS
jgi:hypothetical protein